MMLTLLFDPMLSTLVEAPAADPAATAQGEAGLESLFELLVNGGPMMIPIAICSIITVGFTVERWMRMRPAFLGPRRFGDQVVSSVRDGDVDGALALCSKSRSPLSRILSAGLKRVDWPFLEREKVVEDIAAGEMLQLGAKLRPLFLVFLIAPLLGLLGTVWGMIEAFSSLAAKGAQDNAEVIAAGIYQALSTTAAGLAVAIPSVVAYYWLRGRVEAFGIRTEGIYRDLEEASRGARA
tara:strand:+ start:10613 stop:11326 length:714 start_codon:yes stop_codon:yes gene_type:complete